ncbi:DNA-binding protein [Helicobacter pylori X47-2AL]|uniref:DNA-binding protein HU n=13 Tax=Bacteria TaxID=2 RepID=V6LBQ0_HELPX|nr:DNA-binding protein [Helicobacter pylori X47-2AL]
MLDLSLGFDYNYRSISQARRLNRLVLASILASIRKGVIHMNKAEFIDLVKEAGKYNSKREAEEAISAFTLAVETALSKGESVELIGFGKFETAEQKGKEGKVPGSDKTYKTEDKRVPKFKPGKILKQKVEEGK